MVQLNIGNSKIWKFWFNLCNLQIIILEFFFILSLFITYIMEDINNNIKSNENDKKTNNKKITWNTIFRFWSIVENKKPYYIPLYDDNDVKK